MVKAKKAAATKPPKILGRDEILAAPAPAKVLVKLPGLRGAVYVREMTAGDKDAWEDSMMRRREAIAAGGSVLDNMRASLLALVIVGEDDKPLFTSDDIEALSAKSAKMLEPAFDAACEANGLTEKSAKEIAKNLRAARGGNSSSR